MRLVKLKIQKFMAIDAFEADFRGGAVIVFEGRNGTGKTAHLRAIQALFAGGKAIPDVPIKHGSKKAEIVGETETLICKRTFTAKGTKLEVRPNKKGAVKLTSPQKVLDELIGMFLDPLEFDRMGADRRLVVLRELVGLDFSEEDAKHKALYDERTDVQRDIKRLDAQLGALPEPVDGDEEPQSVADLLTELKRRQQVNDDHASKRQMLAELRARAEELAGVDDEPGEIADIKSEITEMRALLDGKERLLEEAQAELTDLRAKGKPLAAEVELLEDLSTSETEAQIADAEGFAERTAQAKRWRELTAETETLDERREQLNDGMDEIDEAKAETIAATKYPIVGLEACDDGVYLDDVPWDQANASRRIIASTSIGLAVHPKLKIVCVENASLLDDDMRQTMRETVEAAGGQAFLEVVGSGAEVKVVIEGREASS